MFPIFKEVYDQNSISLLDQKGISYSTNGLPNDSGIVWFSFKALQPSYGQITIEHHLHITEALAEQKIFTGAIGGVAPNSPNPTATTSTGPTPFSTGQITVMGFSATPGDTIIFRGTATLPPEKTLLTQVCKDGQAVPWWPSNQEVPIGNNGAWLITVPLDKTGAPNDVDILASEYLFSIWVKGVPSIITNFPIHFAGQPPPGR